MTRLHIASVLCAAMVCLLGLGCGGVADADVETWTGADVGMADAGEGDTASPEPSGAAADVGLLTGGSAGCGLPRSHPPGGVQVVETFGSDAGGERSFFLSVPDTYDPEVPQRLIFGFAGTNWTGEAIADYLGLEVTAPRDGEIYVYPDVQWHDFEGWGELGGWLLGPHAAPADGLSDLAMTRELLAYLSERYCVDPERVFATGHSWGGDMAAVVGCFLGDVVSAVAPAAANRPYWFEPAEGEVGCLGSAAVWTFFGQDDTSFTGQDYQGQYGDEQVDFWRQKHGCSDAKTVLSVGDGECVQYAGCTDETRYCLYGPETGHQVPDYFASAVLQWFRGF